MKVFWSWQSDFSPKTCRRLIKEALVEAIDAVATDLELDVEERLELDHDTLGEPGMVDISSTIFNKITDAGVFVGDITPVGRTSSGKMLPNPNVLIELGWALQLHGVKRCIAVLNTASGCRPPDLPFDLRQKRILQYELADDADKPRRSEARRHLVQQLTAALRLNLGDHLNEKATTAPIRGVPSDETEASIWATARGEITHRVTVGTPLVERMAIELGPRSYIRVIPAPWPSKAPKIREIADLDEPLIVEPPCDPMLRRFGNFGPTDDGYINYWTEGHDQQGRAIARDVAMYFDETGEFWVLHGSAVVPWANYMGFRAKGILQWWSTTVRQAFAVLDHFGAAQTRRVEIGVAGVKDTIWPPELDPNRGSTSRKNRFVHTDQRRDWNAAAQRAFLKEGFDGVRDLFALRRTTDEEFDAFLQKCDPDRGT